ncbi:MAG TPA: type VII secretion protein EccCa [Nocardioidaceae bacterium]|nr:type VII secretion protein EccCa [Nocardioidaceae bacterium]
MTTTLVKRPPRTAPPTVDPGNLEIAEPPGTPQAPPAVAGLGMMMMPMMMGTGALTGALTAGASKIQAVASLLVFCGAICFASIMIVSQRTGPKKQLREGRERYLDYIEQMRHTLRARIAVQRRSEAWRHPLPENLVDLARNDARRWERRLPDSDFLVVRIGTGDQPLASPLTMAADTGPLNEFDPVCLQAAKELHARYSVLRDQPITVDLRTTGAMTVLGAPAATRDLAASMAMELASFHAPHEVQIAVVRSDANADHWDWAKWLPHAQETQLMDGDVPSRLIANSVAGMAEMLAPTMDARLDRHQRARGQQHLPPQHIVVFIDGDGLTTHQHLISPDPSVSLDRLGIHVVALVEHRRDEPEQIDDRIQIGYDGNMTLASRSHPFRRDAIPSGVPSVVSRQLSPLRVNEEEEGGDSLTHTVGLPEILGVDDPARLEPTRTWRPRSLRELLRVPIGIGSNGNTVMLDLKESAHGGMGPHGLVVGATGSGKSEMLRTLVSSLVINHGPDRLALMLVDFKGGATFAAMEDIPHIAGIITNLQDDLTLVDRMHDALFGEMQRRQEILKSVGNLPNVTAYHDLIDAGEPLEPLPHLLVIVDEFSELLTAKPDFAELFVAIGRIGRSIGVHQLLASQKLETGKIRGLESHLSYRISLRTFSETESRDAIGVPDAYHLPPEPGSGYLKVDTTVFERFKAALVSSPYTPPSSGPKTTVPVVPYLSVNGLGAWIAEQQAALLTTNGDEPAGPAARNEKSNLDVICERLAGAGATPVRQVWLEPLPSALPLDSLTDTKEDGAVGTVDAIFGLVDEPAKQHQYPMRWDFTGGAGNLMVLGAPQSGKSTLLRSLIASLCFRYAPSDVVFYCIDFGGGTLRSMADAPHIATVTPRTDPERISRTINDVVTLLERREELFRSLGVSSIEEFRQARADGRAPKDAPGDVFLVIDGWGGFREEYDTLDFTVADISSRGLNYGIHVIVTVNQTMDVRMRMQPSFGGRIELRLNDAFDSQFGRKEMANIPKDAPGRGLVDPGLQFQAALPRIDGVADDEGLSPAVTSLVASLKERWPEQAVQRVRVLPTTVNRDQLPPVDPKYPGVPVGVLDRNLSAASVDLMSSNPHLLIFGDGETGKTNLLRLILRGHMELMPAEKLAIAVVDFRRSLLDVVGKDYNLAYATDAPTAEQVCLEIAASLKKRLPGQDVTSKQLRNRSWWTGPEVLVVVDDYDLVSTSSGNPLNPLVDYFAQGRDLGFHFVMARRMGGFARAQFEPVVQRLNDLGTPGFIFSGDRMEGRVIGGVSAQSLPVGRALYASRNGLAGQVQTAITPE